MKINIKRIILSFILMAALFSTITVNAEGNGGFKIKREVHGVTKHIDNVTTYIVKNDSSNPGVATNLPTDISVRVDADPDTTNIATGYGLIPGAKWQAINFPTPGTYKFIVTEKDTADSVEVPLAKEVYYVYIYVTNKVDENGQPTGEKNISYIGSKKYDTGNKISPTDAAAVDPHTGEPIVQPRNDTEYDNLYTSGVQYTYITIKCDVEGTGANKNKYFKYKVEIEGTPGEQYLIKGQDSVITFKGRTIYTSNIYTVGEDNYIYLKAGQELTIGKVATDVYQIKVGTPYKVTLVDSDGYEPNQPDYSGKTIINPKTNTIRFVNKKGIVLPKTATQVIPIVLIIIMIAISSYIIIKSIQQQKQKV